MQNSLILPDIHHAWEDAERLIQAHPDHTVVFLGDYFDCFADNVNDAMRTARWLGWSIKQPNRIHCLGNHDAWYFGTNRETDYCPGNSKQKRQGTLPHLKPETWDVMRMHYWLTEGILCTHAGLHPCKLHPILPHRNYLRRTEDEAKHACHANLNHPYLHWGTRGGFQYIGGPLWLDWEDFTPIPEIHQIMGHSPRDTPQVKIGADGSVNVMLDASRRSNQPCRYPGGHAVLNGRKLSLYTRNGLFREFTLKQFPQHPPTTPVNTA